MVRGRNFAEAFFATDCIDMNYRDAEEQISAYIDGELPVEQSLRIWHLLARNRRAARLHRELRAAGSALRRLPRYRLPGVFSRKVLQAAEDSMVLQLPAGQADSETFPRLVMPVARSERFPQSRLKLGRYAMLAVASTSVLLVIAWRLDFLPGTAGTSNQITSGGHQAEPAPVDASAKSRGDGHSKFLQGNLPGDPLASGGQPNSPKSSGEDGGMRVVSARTRAASGVPAPAKTAPIPDVPPSARQLELSFACDCESAESRQVVLNQFGQTLADLGIRLAGRSSSSGDGQQAYVVEASARDLTEIILQLKNQAAQPASQFSVRQLGVAMRPVSRAELAAARTSHLDQHSGQSNQSATQPTKGEAIEGAPLATVHGVDGDTVDGSSAAVLHTQRAIFVFRVVVP